MFMLDVTLQQQIYHLVNTYKNAAITHVSHLSYYKLFFRPITLTVAKCWDPTPKGYFTLPPSMHQFFVLCNRPIFLCVMGYKFCCELIAKNVSFVIHKGKILQQFENVKIYKDLYEKPLKRDQVARVVFPHNPFNFP